MAENLIEGEPAGAVSIGSSASAENSEPLMTSAPALPHYGYMHDQHRGVAVSCENIDIRPEDPRQPAVQALLGQSDNYFRALYPIESNHLVSADVLAQIRRHFLQHVVTESFSDQSHFC